MSATPLNLAFLVQALPAGATWAAAGIGRYQFSMNSLAITMGGHVRVGLEDNLYMNASKTQLATNPALVARLVTLARAAEREPASADEARALIGLPSRTPVAQIRSPLADHRSWVWGHSTIGTYNLLHVIVWPTLTRETHQILGNDADGGNRHAAQQRDEREEP